MVPTRTGTDPSVPSPRSPTAAQLTSWGLDPSWSRRVTIDGSDGRPVDWHVLDTGPGPAGTIVCVHGNPSWGYIWKGLLTELAPDWRVMAIDQTGMGWSERDRPRRLVDRVAELVTFCRQEVDGPLVLAAHDWGGPVAVGASGSLDVDALILANTAVAKPDDVAVPPLIAAARRLVDLSCRRSPAFVAGTAHMTARVHRDALCAPYRTADRREAVRDFVADIPVTPADPSYGALRSCAEVLDQHRHPTLLLWGGRDPVFHDRFLADLRARIPHADVERFADAAHLVTLDAPVGPVVARWLTEGRHRIPVADRSGDEADGAPFLSVLASLGTRGDDTSAAYDGPDGVLSWADLEARSSVAAHSLQRAGLLPGDRVSLLVPPSCELLVAAGATWKAGGVPVVADASAGIRRLRRLVRAAAPKFVVGTRTTLAAAGVLRFAPGATRLAVGHVPGIVALEPAGSAGGTHTPVPPGAHDVAAIVHTSGATGPAKAVRYTHGALAAQRDVVGPLFGMHPGDAFTTSFGPFMLLAPSLQMTCVRPDFPIDRPSALGFDGLRAATERAEVTVAWLSPASARRIVATAHGGTVPIGLVMLAGAPIPPDLVAGVRAVTCGDVRTPYGMTECLPVTDGTDAEAVGPLGGNSTGRPVPGCTVVVTPLDDPGTRLSDGAWGELLVHAPWMFDGYDAAWSADADTWAVHDDLRYHRTGDVGYVHDGLLFHLGRRRHVLDTAAGPLASVAVEEPIRAATGRPVAAVGVGPAGAQVVCIVVDGPGRLAVADRALRDAVRAATAQRIASVLVGPLPVDRRHESKIDRTTLGVDAGRFLAGR